MRAFAFEQPRSLPEAFAILSRSPDARFLSGGTDLIIRLRDGTIRTTTVIDVKRIRELDASISEGSDRLFIGGRTVMTQLLEDPRVRSRYTALAEAAAFVGSVQIRNRATLAGNVVNASPAADTVPALLVFDATVVVSGPAGERRIAIDDVFVRSMVTTISPTEIVTGIELPVPGPLGSVHLRRTRRRGHDLAAVTLACVVLESGETRVAYGSLGPRPLRVTDTSGALADPSASDAARAEVLDRLFAEARPSPTSMRASADYRLAMLRLLGLRGAEIARGRLADRSAGDGSAAGAGR